MNARSLRYLNSVLTVLAVLLALNLWTTWSVTPDVGPAAYAQGIPDEGAQRKQMIDLLKSLNQSVDQMKELFTSGKAKVQVAGVEGNKKNPNDK